MSGLCCLENAFERGWSAELSCSGRGCKEPDAVLMRPEGREVLDRGIDEGDDRRLRDPTLEALGHAESNAPCVSSTHNGGRRARFGGLDSGDDDDGSLANAFIERPRDGLPCERDSWHQR